MRAMRIGKLFKGPKTSGMQRQFLLQCNDSILWSSSYIYDIFDLTTGVTKHYGSILLECRLKGIAPRVFVIEFMKNNACVNAGASGRENQQLTCPSFADEIAVSSAYI